MLLPEVAQAEGEAAARAADVAEPGGAPAAARADPAVALLGALAQGEAVGGQLGEGVVAPLGDVLQTGSDPLVPGGGVRELLPGELGRLDGGSGVAAQAGDALDGLAEQTGALAADPDVAVVGLVAHRDGEADAEPADEVAARPARLLLPVERDGVHHAEGVGAGVEVEADGEGEPAAVALAVFAVDADDGADGALLLDLHVVDRAVEALVLDRALVAVLDLGLAQQDEAAVLRDLGGAPGDRLDQRRSGRADSGGDDAGRYVDGAAVPGDGNLLGGSGRGAGGEGEPAAARGDGVGGPLEGAVGPVGERPGLHGYGLAVGVRDGERLAFLEGAPGPGDADGGAGGGPEAAVLQPAQGDGAVVGDRGGGGRGLCVLRAQCPAELGGGAGDGGRLEEGPAGDGGHGLSFPCGCAGVSRA
ncbi:hypothetical protein SLI_1835 [Streptomyces lividans 1326]|uniref:Uncharacterized protein n=1 Tax=Streptomyces lividans 1326 TaxID=1200984 RepID=A0A7U9DQD8_STRLI|nr:hypothetical protein SLI_1835 [Streptomyces lividans 1326]